MTDEKQVEEFEKRIDELESIVRLMLPSRRDALKLGVAGVAGAAAIGGSASANAGTGDGEVGTIGTASDKVDMFAQDIEVDKINGAEISSANEGEALTSDGNGNLVFNVGFNPTGPYVTGLGGGSFTNPENVPIFVIATINIRSSRNAKAFVDGIKIADTNQNTSDGERANLSFIVPAGQDYQISGTVMTHSYLPLG